MSLPAGVVELVNFLIPACIFALMALALNIQWGHTGLFNAGVAAFWAIGAYTAAILLTGPAPPTPQYPGHLGGFSQHIVVAVLAAVGVSALGGLLIALPLIQLRADYFAIATLALAEVVRLVLTNAGSLTAGTIGIILIPRPLDAAVGRDPDLSDLTIAIIALGVLLIAFLLIEYMTRAPWGRVLRAVREDEEATLAMGKNVFSFKLQAFVLGCAFMGLAGAVLAIHLRFVTPNQFDPLATFTIYVMVILGGSGNNRGVIAGAFIFYAFDWASVRLDDPRPVAQAVAYALLLALPGLLLLGVGISSWIRRATGAWDRGFWILVAGLILLLLAAFPLFPVISPLLVERVPYLRMMTIGLILVLLIMFRPEGVFKEKKRTYPPVTSDGAPGESSLR